MRLRYDSDVFAIVKIEGLRFGFPDVERDPHHFTHRRLKIEITDDTESDPRRSGRHPCLVHNRDIRALARRFQILGQMPRRAQTVDTRSNHQIVDLLWNGCQGSAPH